MKKNQVLLIGTHNNGKFKEISKLLNKKIKTISPKSLEIESPKETGKTFTSNSKLKANFFSQYIDYPVISDESGLCIRALNQQPGVYSARLAKRHGSFLKAMKYILNKMKNKKNRSATFVCSLSFKFPEKKTINAPGKIKGTISYKILGKNGFGYDSIFIPNNYNKTFGEMFKSDKIKIDHRFIAFKNLKKKIKTL